MSRWSHGENLRLYWPPTPVPLNADIHYRQTKSVFGRFQWPRGIVHLVVGHSESLNTYLGMTGLLGTTLSVSRWFTFSGDTPPRGGYSYIPMACMVVFHGILVSPTVPVLTYAQHTNWKPNHCYQQLVPYEIYISMLPALFAPFGCQSRLTCSSGTLLYLFLFSRSTSDLQADASH